MAKQRKTVVPDAPANPPYQGLALSGARLVLTPELQAEMVDLLRGGNYLDTAAAVAGTTPRSARRWLQRGAKAIRDIEADHYVAQPNDSAYIEFYRAVKQARAHAEARNVANVNSVALGRQPRTEVRTIEHPDGRIETTTTQYEGVPPNWTASAWYLERTRHDKFGRRDKREITGKNGAPLIDANAIHDIIAREARGE